MPSTKPSRTARRLLKLASLGLAGLLAGLIAGCTASPEDAVNVPPYAHISNDWEFTPATAPNPKLTNLPDSIDAHQIPALRHPPSARRLEYGTVHLSHQPLSPLGPDRS